MPAPWTSTRPREQNSAVRHRSGAPKTPLHREALREASMRKAKHQSRQLESLPPVAGNGLIDRRALLGRGVMFASAAAAGVGSTVGAAAEPLVEGPWSNEVGAVIRAYQVASRFEKHVVRTVDNPDNVPRNSRARTPHHLLQGIITPNGLHFTICHGGVPDIDPDKHRLVIHGLVRQPLVV